jgi:hypothetical protein
MDLTDLEREYRDLSNRHAAGRLSDEDFQSAVAQLVATDTEGRPWGIRPEDGKKYLRLPQRYPEPEADARPAPRFCSACGAAVVPGYAFCQRCGDRLPEPQPAKKRGRAQDVRRRPIKRNKPPSDARWRRRTLAALALLLGLVCVFGGLSAIYHGLLAAYLPVPESDEPTTLALDDDAFEASTYTNRELGLAVEYPRGWLASGSETETASLVRFQPETDGPLFVVGVHASGVPTGRVAISEWLDTVPGDTWTYAVDEIVTSGHVWEVAVARVLLSDAQEEQWYFGTTEVGDQRCDFEGRMALEDWATYDETFFRMMYSIRFAPQ